MPSGAEVARELNKVAPYWHVVQYYNDLKPLTTELYMNGQSLAEGAAVHDWVCLKT